jgi:hypothetical protein
MSEQHSQHQEYASRPAAGFATFHQEEYWPGITSGATSKVRQRGQAEVGHYVLDTNDTAMVNEVLCKFLCRNRTCLIQKQGTLGIVSVFWKDEAEEKCDGPAISSMVRPS